MSNYQRLISYIYAYEGGIKGKNIGFAKIDTRGSQCKIAISVKKIFVGGNPLGVYLLSDQNEVRVGTLFARNGAGEFRTTVNSSNVEGSGCGMDEFYGLSIHDVESAWRAYTTIWEDAVAHAAEIELADVTAENVLKRKSLGGGNESLKIEERSKAVLPISDEIEAALEKEKTAPISAAVEAADKKQALRELEEAVVKPQGVTDAGTLETPEIETSGEVLETQSERVLAEKWKEPKRTPPPDRSENQPQAAPAPAVPGSQAGTQQMAAPGAPMGTPQEIPCPGTPEPPQDFPPTRTPGIPPEIPPSFIPVPLQETPPPATPECQPEMPAAAPESPAITPSQGNTAETLQEAAPRPPREKAWKGPRSCPANQSANDWQNRGSVRARLLQEQKVEFAVESEVINKENLPETEKADTNRDACDTFGTTVQETAVQQDGPMRYQEAEKEEVPAARILTPREEKETCGQQEMWEILRRKYPKILAFDYADGCEILTIKPQDIGLLPRDTWVYGNNSFLLHGYYNYRYLILARLENPKGNARYLLGVPGNYFSNEKYMASMFGFTDFVLSKKQPRKDGRFGYWYTDIKIGD